MSDDLSDVGCLTHDDEHVLCQRADKVLGCALIFILCAEASHVGERLGERACFQAVANGEDVGHNSEEICGISGLKSSKNALN
jgi:hypothetical protein